MMNKELSNKQLFTLALYVIFLPLIVLIFDKTQLLFLNIHIAISILLVLCLLSLVIFKHRLNSLVRTFLLVLILVYPSLVFSVYPFSLLSAVFVFILVVSGLLIPIFSVKATWWLYTIGGRLPLPFGANWLGKSKGNYESFIKVKLTKVILLVPITIIFLQLSRIFEITENSGAKTVALLLKILSSLVVFGLSLTFGMHIKKYESS